MLDDGNILRVSTTQNSVLIIILGLMQPIILIIVIALIISLILSYRISGSIIKPINDLDPDNPDENVAYEELTPLLNKLNLQKRTISNQIKDAEKSREEFRLICENMSEGFLVTDRDAKILSYNSAEGSVPIDGRTYNLIANPVYNSNEIIGTVIVIIDVTEITKREQLRREFTANVSHELNPPSPQFRALPK